jgi:hypothetical protein
MVTVQHLGRNILRAEIGLLEVDFGEKIYVL